VCAVCCPTGQVGKSGVTKIVGSIILFRNEPMNCLFIDLYNLLVAPIDYSISGRNWMLDMKYHCDYVKILIF